MTVLHQIGEWIKSLLHKMPDALANAAKSSLVIMEQVEGWLKSDSAILLSDLIAHDQAERLAIISVLDTLEAAIHVLTDDNDKKAIMAKRGALITKVLHGGDLPQNIYDSAFQATFTDKRINS